MVSGHVSPKEKIFSLPYQLSNSEQARTCQKVIELRIKWEDNEVLLKG